MVSLVKKPGKRTLDAVSAVVIRFLLWHGCSPGLSTAGERDPWVAYLGQLAHRSLEQVFGAYPADASGFWTPPDFLDADDLALGVEDHPSVWTEGSWEEYPIGGFELVGAGGHAGREAPWSTTEEHGGARLERCRIFMPVPGPLQTVQRAEFWGAILALQAFWPGHLGIDNLNAVRFVGRLLDQGSLSRPLPLATCDSCLGPGDGSGHQGCGTCGARSVRLEDNFGNSQADTAADLGRCHQPEEVMDIRRVLLNAREYWYTIVLQLHQFLALQASCMVGSGTRWLLFWCWCCCLAL